MNNAKEEPYLSLGVPVYEESPVLDPFLARIREVLGGHFERLFYEVKEPPVYIVEGDCGEANGKGGASINEQPEPP